MRYQDFIIQITKQVGDDLFRSVKSMPPDKLTWRPLGEGRSALDILQECAQGAKSLSMLLSDNMEMPDDEKMAAWQEEREAWTSVEDCEKAYEENIQTSLRVIRETPDERLDQMIPHPYGKSGEKWSVAEALLSIYWHYTYHLGQIDYIQTLYGDRSVH